MSGIMGINKPWELSVYCSESGCQSGISKGPFYSPPSHEMLAKFINDNGWTVDEDNNPYCRDHSKKDLKGKE